MRTTTFVAPALAAALAATALGGPPAPASPAAPATVEQSCAERTLGELSVAQRVGQLFVAGVDADDPTSSQLARITDYHLGGVILTGGSDAGVQTTRQVSDAARARASTSNGIGLWVSADQEGGYVQHLEGPGFATIPTALEQGGLDQDTLRSRARTWGGQLREAGVNLNLAPVLDTVPEELGRGNKPIGYYYRQYGYTPEAVAGAATAFQRGMSAAGVQPTGKHFPGLGRVRENTDTSGEVLDEVTTRQDPYLHPFQVAVDNGIPLIMASTARYTLIDPANLAAFSPTVLRGMLRDDLGFTGVIISDDLGNAAAVQDIPVGERATRFLGAGGTVVLTVDSATVPRMFHEVILRARADPEFRAVVDEAALAVLRAKDRIGLLPHCP
ncbi:glycoside hydrolase family 3 N-terminal domain-containing protein [Amycolatopsis aidingensis]|uniref:glycoside hydrolase family 3 N-terminal domain-containing protein n=1 Tax=Amycolatopsis aidingensis TaxID=2842453 RepID=UPI001C0D3D26|nr:glycoside hydrolase family 3 N-terminal domain-containing protein [Amycolatopsis aidingensis]